MQPQEYILSRLEDLKAISSSSCDGNLADYITKCALSKKFRKYSVSPEYISHIHAAVELNIQKNEPIKFTLVFGGYKLWRLDESPEADWAELFSIIYYVCWIKPIAAVYEPGVWFDFYSDDIIVSQMNGVPKKDLETYLASFEAILQFVKPYLPTNIEITLNSVGDQYKNDKEFQDDLRAQMATVKSPAMLTSEQVAAIDLNVRSHSDIPNWREQVQLMHDGYSQVSKRRSYYRTADKIVVITRPASNTVAVGTTKNSVMKFWIGAGVLKQLNDTFQETILSPHQLEQNKTEWKAVSIPGLKLRNFQKIRIIV